MTIPEAITAPGVITLLRREGPIEGTDGNICAGQRGARKIWSANNNPVAALLLASRRAGGSGSGWRRRSAGPTKNLAGRHARHRIAVGNAEWCRRSPGVVSARTTAESRLPRQNSSGRILYARKPCFKNGYSAPAIRSRKQRLSFHSFCVAQTTVSDA